MSWEELPDFAQYQRSKGLALRTIASRDQMLKATARVVGRPAVEVTTSDLRARLGRGIARGSMQTERDCYRAFFRFLLEEGYREDDPSARLARVRAPRGRPRPYTSEQIDALLASGAYARTRAMILLACYQGLRAAEVAAVHGHDVDLIAGTLRVVGKGGKHSVLPLHPHVVELAQRMPTDEWWFPARRGAEGHITSGSVSTLMGRAKRRAGITDARLTGHSLRHSYGTSLVRAGVDLRTVQELMRHESLATTQIYTLVDEEQLRAGLHRLPYRDLPSRSGRSAA